MTKNYYDQMLGTVSASLRKQWEKEILLAESQRFEDPTVMEVLGARYTGSDADLDRGRDDLARSGLKWLTLALALEEKQSVI
jgi:hypothetical protein